MINHVTHIIRAALCLFALSASAAAFEIEEHKSPDGHIFSYVHMPDATQTVIRFVWTGGYAFVPSGKENIEELGPVLMVKGGSAGLSPDELIKSLDALGGGVQLYSDTDAFHAILTGTEGNLSETGALMHTVLAEPLFEPRWLKRFQRNFVENVSARVKTVAGQAWQTMRELTVGDHPLRQAWNATPLDAMSSITVEDIREWHRRTVTASGVTLFAAGNAGAEEVAKAIDQALVGLPKEAARQDFAPLVMQYPAKTILVHRPDAEKSYILIGGPIPTTYSDNQEEREIGIGVLGVSHQSRLFTAIRSELRAAYGFKA